MAAVPLFFYRRWKRIVASIAICSLLGAVGAPGLRTAARAQEGAAAQTDWPYYGQNLGGDRYADSDQINAGNVSQLKPAWILHTGIMSEHMSFETQPIEVGGTLYVSAPDDHVFALNAATGDVKWVYNPSDMVPINKLTICCGITNRGVAYDDGKVFIARLDDTLVALDASNGKTVWEQHVNDPAKGFSETMAPQVVDGEVIVGQSGGEVEDRGDVTAYAESDGHQLWRFYTVPGKGEPGNDTWSGDSWRHGGGTVWTTPSVDPQLGLIYITTGNAAPDLNGSKRAGKNLYTASIVALEAKTGKMRWYFQEVHHDLWDYDADQPAQLFDVDVKGATMPAIGEANKDGFYFVLNRETGKPIVPVHEVSAPRGPSWQHASPTQPASAIVVTPQSVNPSTTIMPHPQGAKDGTLFSPPAPEAQLIQPGFESGPEWGAAAYSPRTHEVYIPAGGYEPWIYHAQRDEVNTLASTAFGNHAPGSTYGIFEAIDIPNRKIAWSLRVPHKTVTGVAVAGDLVFFGQSNGKFDAVDDKTGKILWSWHSDEPGFGGANGSPAAYVVDGREYVVMAFGGNVRERSDSPTPTSKPGDALVAFALPQSGASSPHVVTAQSQPAPMVKPKKIAMASSAPSDATVLTLTASELTFSPKELHVKPGEKVAIHLENRNEDLFPVSLAIALPSGPIAMKGMVKAGQDAYFVFTGPLQAGSYPFFSPLGAQKAFGLRGKLLVQ